MPGVVQISCLGHLGRFGNQLFQYAAARGYARKIGATLEIPPWHLGAALFKNIDHPIIQRPLPTMPINVVPDNRCDVNLYGYFQSEDVFALYTMEDLRHWFEFQDWVKEAFKDLEPAATAAHIRRGDYVTTYAGAFCTIDEAAYQSAFAEYACPGSVTWVREDQPRKFDRPGMEFLLDFYILMTAKVLVRANSTFSWWAGALGNQTAIYSPMIDGLRGHCKDVKFVPGNWPRTADHPGVNHYHIK